MKSEHIQPEGENNWKSQNNLHVASLKHFCSMDKFQCLIYNFLVSVKSNSSTPYNNVLRVKDATQDITFWSIILGLLNKGHTKKKWNSSSFTNPHEQIKQKIRQHAYWLKATIQIAASHPDFRHNNLFLSGTNKKQWIFSYTSPHSIFESYIIYNGLGFRI